MMIMENPLTQANLSINDISTASLALRLANDNYFAVYHQGQEMLRELARLSGEIYKQKYALVEPHLKPNVNTGVIPTYIPNPLPETVPDEVKAAMAYLDEQYAAAEEIAQAELAENVVELNEARAYLEGIVAEWFKSEIGADWLGGKKKFTVSGATLTYSNGNVTFSYEELEY